MSKCNYCGKGINYFTGKSCAFCHKEMCGKCITPVEYSGYTCKLLEKVEKDFVQPYSTFVFFGKHYLCRECAVGYNSKFSRMSDAEKKNSDIETFPNTYKGKLINRLTKVKRLSSAYYRDRSDAEEELRTMAKYLGCTHVIEISWDRYECEEKGPKGGTHVYNEWSAVGYAAK